MIKDARPFGHPFCEWVADLSGLISGQLDRSATGSGAVAAGADSAEDLECCQVLLVSRLGESLLVCGD